MVKQPCPCGTDLPFARCCGPFLRGEALAPTAESLMRSRYTAYVQEAAQYLLQTWHCSTRPDQLSLQQQPPLQWLGLRIVRTEAGTETDAHGSVEFIARYKINGKAERLHETSQFVREDGRWFYLRGEFKAE